MKPFCVVTINELHLDGYTWLGNNCKESFKRAVHGSGGVGLFIRDSSQSIS